MFTKIREGRYEGRLTDDYACLSTDIKPTDGIGNGDSCIEMDASALYFFDADSATWQKWRG